MKALGTVYASFVLILIVTAILIASYQMINNQINQSNKAMHDNIRKLDKISNKPVLDITYTNNSLYLVVQVIEPIKIRYVFIDYMNGTISFIQLNRYVVNTTYIKLPVTDYTHPFKAGIIVDPGITIYYNPMKDPWLINNNIIPNTTYIDQNLINEIQRIGTPTMIGMAGFSPVLINNTVIINSVNSTITVTDMNLTTSPLRIKLQITRLITPNFTITYPVTRSQVLENNGIAKLATITVRGYPINVYAIYTTFSSVYLFSAVGILINSSVSTNMLFNGTIKVQQSMAPTPVNLGGYLVKINNQYLNTPLALAPDANTSINLRGKQYVKQVGLNKITYLTINGSIIGNISSDGMIVLGYGRYIKNVWGAPTEINITVDLNITSIEFISWDPKPALIGIDSDYITIQRWRIGVSTPNSDNYAKALFNLFKLTGYYKEDPLLIISYGKNTVFRKITPSTSPIYVKTNYTVAVKPSIPQWLLQWRSILKINVITTRSSPFQYQVFRVIGGTSLSSSALYITLFPDVLVLQQFPSRRTLLIIMPHYYNQIGINAGYTWQYLVATIYNGTTIEIHNPFNKTIVLSIIPLNLKEQGEPLTMYYEPEILSKTSDYYLTMRPGINNATIILPPGYYLIVPLSPNDNILYVDPLIVRII